MTLKGKFSLCQSCSGIIKNQQVQLNEVYIKGGICMDLFGEETYFKELFVKWKKSIQEKVQAYTNDVGSGGSWWVACQKY